MNLDFTPEENAFREEVRAFIRDNYPKELTNMGSREDLTRDQFLAWHKILGKKGWSAVAWPTKYGGTGWTSTQRYIWSEENARVDALMPLLVAAPLEFSRNTCQLLAELGDQRPVGGPGLDRGHGRRAGE